MKPTYTRLRLLLGDQLNHHHGWFSETDTETLYVLAELHSEMNYVTHHIQKICGFFVAMQTFAKELSARGHEVLYLTLDDTVTTPDLGTLLTALSAQYHISEFEYQRADEYRLLKILRQLSIPGVKKVESDTEHFLVHFSDLPAYFKRGKAHRMETFYRRLRRETGFLMQSNQPVGGSWNYDSSNRNKLSAPDIQNVPEPFVFNNNCDAELARIDRHGVETIGEQNTRLWMPTNREQSMELLEYFCNNCLVRFGRFQDAMTDQSAPGGISWSLYHSRLSFALNLKMISPLEVIRAAIRTFQARDDIDIAQIEGFVRQILGWREFVRGIYWANMPDYSELNELKAHKTLPAFFWTGKTQMNCLAQAITQSLEWGYAHHIQRLMVTGVFGMLAGVHPDEMDAWYLGIYVDAIDWVELPNTRGMSQFADGGLVASKPYAASGNYINKMSDYCKSCQYNVKTKTEVDSCPLNSLYWHFMVQHRQRLEKNPRIGMVYKNWDKSDQLTKSATLARAHHCLSNLDDL